MGESGTGRGRGGVDAGRSKFNNEKRRERDGCGEGWGENCCGLVGERVNDEGGMTIFCP